jgi:hypothetical protein
MKIFYWRHWFNHCMVHPFRTLLHLTTVAYPFKRGIWQFCCGSTTFPTLVICMTLPPSTILFLPSTGKRLPKFEPKFVFYLCPRTLLSFSETSPSLQEPHLKWHLGFANFDPFIFTSVIFNS